MAEPDRLFLTFRLDRQLYALPAGDVAEVIRVPPLARIPQAPPGLAGLANLRGAVLPVASLAGLLNRAPPPVAAPPSAHARAIVLAGETDVALLVDRVEALVPVAASRIETTQSALAASPGERIAGAFPTAGGETAKVLDIHPLLAAAFAPPERPAHPRPSRLAPGNHPAPSPDRPGSGNAVREKLVTFEVAGQVFALPLARVRAVAPAPTSLAAIPGSDALGVAPWRGGLLALFTLRGLLGLPFSEPDGRARMIVTTVAGVAVGLIADRMRGLLAADPDRIEPVPALLSARIGGEARVAAIHRGEDGLVSILSPDTLFREDTMRRLSQAAPTPRPDEAQARAAERRFLVFRLADDEFALPIEAVDEVAAAPARLTHVPRTPAFLEGVINLRGQVLPVVDQRRRFDMPPAAPATRRRLVVVRSARHRAGLIVDDVSDVLSHPADAVDPAPHLSGETARLVEGVINLAPAGRMILVLDPAELLSRAERGILDRFAKAGHAA
jgi:purine-binding chemotaxis protein CheW